MSFSDNEDAPAGMYDYGALPHPIHEDATTAKALVELQKIARQEAELHARIAVLSRPYALPNVPPTACNVVSLRAYRDFLRHSVRS